MGVQVDREQTSGALNMVFVGSPITNAYANLTNVILRIAPRRVQHAKAVLVNAHFDTVFGTPGAGLVVLSVYTSILIWTADL